MLGKTYELFVGTNIISGIHEYIGIKRVSLQRGFTVLDSAMITLKRHVTKFMLMLVSHFTFYSH